MTFEKDFFEFADQSIKNNEKYIENGGKNFKIPILICQETSDTLLDDSGAKLLYNKININDKKIIYYKNANHSLLFDKNSIKIYYDLLKWIKSH
ncbi:MAG: serine aminopeptidase domain-containing protein [Candidatus Helarchaeota archaeon]